LRCTKGTVRRFPLQAVEVAHACGREREVLFGASWPPELHRPRPAMLPRHYRGGATAPFHQRADRHPAPARRALLRLLDQPLRPSLRPHVVGPRPLPSPSPHFRGVTGKPIRRPAVAQHFHYLRKLRNRIAHHEPIFARSLLDDHESLLEVADWMYPDLRAWIASVSPLPRLLAVRPQLTP